MKLAEHQITTVVYENESKSETTTRVVIPTSVPKEVVRVIDVDDLTPPEREHMLSLYSDYREYTKAYLGGMYNFETWAEHAKNEKITPKWRAFKTSGLKT